MKSEIEPAELPPSPPISTAETGIFGRHRWAPFVLPLLVYLLLGHFEPKPVAAKSNPFADDFVEPFEDDTQDDLGFISPDWYPLYYTARIGLTLAVMLLALSTYRSFPFRVSPLAVGCGVVGVFLWVGICHLELENRFLLPALSGLFGDGERAAYNPLDEFADRPLTLIGFLGVRFLGLALVVPVIEEFFLRGFLLRFVQEAQWWKLPIGAASGMVWGTVIVYAALTHPGEMIAAVIWFSLVTLLVNHTRNIWDGVAAHVVTNFLLGIYVISTHQWQLW